MTRMFRWLLIFLCFAALPFPALAQCRRSGIAADDQLCRSLQYILYAAQTDFREFRSGGTPTPDVSFGSAKVPCQLSNWANNVPMVMCYGEVFLPDAEAWYIKTLAALQQLQYLWHFKIDSAGTDHYVDGGPPDCEVPPSDGPYRGQCPLHLQAVKQADGTSKVYLWVDSYSSPYLAPKPPPPPSKPKASHGDNSAQTASASPAAFGTPADCDDLCNGLKEILAARATAFNDLRPSNANPDASNIVASNSASESLDHNYPAVATVSSDPPAPAPSPGAAPIDFLLKLLGTTNCSVSGPAPSAGPSTASPSAAAQAPTSAASSSAASSTAPASAGAGETQYSCYWSADSPAAAEARFHDISARLQLVIPSTWTTKKDDSIDQLSGAKIVTWFSLDPSGRTIVRLFSSGQSVGLHVAATN
jgi:hypothetical protein